MKKTISIIIIFIMLSMVAGCGNTKKIDGVHYDTYGMFNKVDNRNPDIQYRLIVGNVVWSIILVETIAAPVYFIGFSLYEPVGKLNPNRIKGQVGS